MADYAKDDVWRRQTDAVREMLRGDFDRLTLLADSTEVARTQAGGFGIALFDNYVSPVRRAPLQRCRKSSMNQKRVFSCLRVFVAFVV